MNFVNRHFLESVGSEAVPPAYSQPLSSARKWPIRYQSIELLALCADVAAILFASLLATWLYRIYDGSTAVHFGKAVGAALVVSALFASNMRDKYRPTELLVLRNQVRAVCFAWAFVFLLLAVAVSALSIGSDISQAVGLLFAAISLAALVAVRVAIKAILVRGLSGRRFAGGNVVLITDQPPSHEAGLMQTLMTLGFSVTGLFRLPPHRSSSEHRKRLSARVIEHIRGTDTEEVIVEADPNRWTEMRAFIADLRVLPCPIVFVPVGTVSAMFRRPTRDLGSAVCVELQRGPLTGLERAAKRLIDLIGASIALVMLAPLLAVSAIAIKLDSPGSVLFRQKRCGFNGRSFEIYKFRTMFVLEDGPTVVQAQPVDSRVTRVGKWLRRTSIDELPQLLNVLNGSMSLVGPRPHAVVHDCQFDKMVRNYAFRRRVKPGLTGWAQIHGCRGPTPTTTLVERRIEYDLWYIDNWSLRLDLTILLRTPIEVLRGSNAY